MYQKVVYISSNTFLYSNKEIKKILTPCCRGGAEVDITLHPPYLSMSLPPALQARLEKRGIIQTSTGKISEYYNILFMFLYVRSR